MKIGVQVLGVAFAAAAGAASRIELPVVDAPFNFAQDYSAPSFSQSLAISNSFYRLSHRGIQRLFGDDEARARMGGGRRFALGVSIGAFDFLSSYLPGGSSWLHEEWHRGVMSRRGVSSFNDVYKFQFFSELIAVSRETDEALAKMKREHPVDFVRLPAAGMESQLVQNQEFKRATFFENERIVSLPLMWMNNLTVILYLGHCAGPQSDTTTAAQNSGDGGDVSKRDFTGLDCNGWAYDLFRPDEPYEARGIHSSGIGIDRYRKWSDLSGREQNFLRRQAYMSYLNLIDPQLIGFRSFSAGEWAWTFQFQHFITSFGYSVDTDLYLKRDRLNLVLKTHLYGNPETLFPGLEAELVRYPVSTRWFLTSRLGLWLQPKRQRFDDVSAKPGGVFTFRGNYGLSERWELFGELEAKTSGWLAGNVYTDPNTSLRMGASFTAF